MEYVNDMISEVEARIDFVTGYSDEEARIIDVQAEEEFLKREFLDLFEDRDRMVWY